MEYVPIDRRPRTLIIDIDGCLFRQKDFWPDIVKINELLPGVKEKLKRWHMRGDRIVLISARPEGYRGTTEHQLRKANLMWDVLLMGMPTGQRILINDVKPEQTNIEMAIAVNLERDKGMEGLEI